MLLTPTALTISLLAPHLTPAVELLGSPLHGTSFIKNTYDLSAAKPTCLYSDLYGNSDCKIAENLSAGTNIFTDLIL